MLFIGLLTFIDSNAAETNCQFEASAALLSSDDPNADVRRVTEGWCGDVGREEQINNAQSGETILEQKLI